MTNILAISGSLRQASSNTNLLRAAALLAAPDRVTLYDGLGDLPHFNPDREDEKIVAVQQLRSRLEAADAVLISTPEYAHGLPGVLKNALDWLVGSGELIDKPIALLNPSPNSTYAVDSLTEILRVMNARLVPEACLTLPLRATRLSPEEIVGLPDVSPSLQAALLILRQSVRNSTTESSVQ